MVVRLWEIARLRAGDGQLFHNPIREELPTIRKLASGRGFFGLTRAGISPGEKLFDMTEKVVTFGAVATKRVIRP